MAVGVDDEDEPLFIDPLLLTLLLLVSKKLAEFADDEQDEEDDVEPVDDPEPALDETVKFAKAFVSKLAPTEDCVSDGWIVAACPAVGDCCINKL